MPELIINVIDGCRATSMTQANITWQELQKLLSGADLRKGVMSAVAYHTASDSDKKANKDGPAWIPCSVLNQEGRRVQGNMDQMYALVLDIDEGLILEDVKARISGYEAIIHSSYSHSLTKPKWRVVLPFLTPIPAADCGKVFDHFQTRFDGQLDATCGHDSARLYYLPACPADAEHLFVFEHLSGALLDAVALLQTTTSVVPMRVAVLPSAGTSHGSSGGIDEGGRNNDIFKHACRLFEDGHSIEDASADCLTKNACNTPPLDENEVTMVVASAKKHVERKALVSAKCVDEIVDLFNEDYAWVEKQGRVWRFRFRDFVPFDQLRQQFTNTGMRVNDRGMEKWLNHAEIWQHSNKRRTHTNVNFIPGGDATVDNNINLWEGWGVMAAPGDIVPWDNMMDHIFAGDLASRRWFEQWLAYPLQHPGAKMATAAVLWSVTQGVGKSIIGETIGKLYGRHFRTITSTELHGSFNGWMKGCQFALGEENSSSDQRADANWLKFLITGATISVNEKHQPAIELNNCANFIFTSNHADAFYLEDADRRFFIWEIVGERKANEFYEKFIDWRDNGGGLAALMQHLLAIDLSGFSHKDNAPATDAKREMIGQSKTELERWLSEVTEDADSVKAVFGKEVVHIDEVTDIYCRERRVRATTTAVSKALKRQHNSAKRRVLTSGRRHNILSLVNHANWEKASNAEWTLEFERQAPISL